MLALPLHPIRFNLKPIQRSSSHASHAAPCQRQETARKIVAHKVRPRARPTHQSAPTSPSRPSGMSTPWPLPCTYLHRATRRFFSYHTEVEYLVVSTHGPVVTPACIYQFSKYNMGLAPRGARKWNERKKKKKCWPCHVMHITLT